MFEHGIIFNPMEIVRIIHKRLMCVNTREAVRQRVYAVYDKGPLKGMRLANRTVCLYHPLLFNGSPSHPNSRRVTVGRIGSGLKLRAQR